MPGPGAPTPPQAPPSAPPVTIEDVIELLRDDSLRGFRIDIETDQLVEADEQKEQAQALGFVKEVGGLLGAAMQMQQSPVAPALMPAVGETIMYAVRRFRAGRQLEEVFENAFQKVAWMAEQPKPPGPEEAKAQIQAQSDQAKLAGIQAKAEAEGQKAQLGVQAVQAKAEADFQKLALDRERMMVEQQRDERMAQMEERMALLDHQLKVAAHAMERQAMEHDAALSARDREHQSAMQQQEAAFGAAQPAAPATPTNDTPFGA